LREFGAPAIFFTITPDDQRNFRIVMHSLRHVVNPYNIDEINNLSDAEIVFEMHIRKQARMDFPGFCAEEYKRIVDIVIKHVFNWNKELGCSNGPGLFSEVEAWCLATEEQGRKTLHGHFLVFIKEWNSILDCLQRKKEDPAKHLTVVEATRTALRFHDYVCSSRMFQDFEPNKPLDRYPVFRHEGCRSRRREESMRFAVDPVPKQQLRNLRHKHHCCNREIQGILAVCRKCGKSFANRDIISDALTNCIGKRITLYQFPEGSVKRLDQYVYELQKDFDWISKSNLETAERNFASNVLTNSHLETHARRCFKKNNECFAKLPEEPCEKTMFLYNVQTDQWSDWLGAKEERCMFCFRSKRKIAYAYTNTHNPLLCSAFGCNNNILFCMTGPIVMYVTGYNAKSQQQEERETFENVSRILRRMIANQVVSLSVQCTN
jgi:hypothetical protein